MGRPAPNAIGALLLAVAVGCTHSPTPIDLLNQANIPSKLPSATLQSSPVSKNQPIIPAAASAPTPPKTDATAAVDDKAPSSTDGGALSERMTFCEAIDFGLRNNPRLRSALASIERSQGQEQVAFAPFLPRIDMLNRYVATTSTLSPGAPGPTGGIIPHIQGPYDAWQSELQIQWTLYDFGRTSGRYGQAVLRKSIAQQQAHRMRETIAFEIAAAYLQALEAAAVRKIAEESIRRAEAVLEDTKARRAAGVALKDDVLRIDVELAAARDSLVRAQEAELAAQARLNNGMGRDASLPVVLADEPREPDFRSTLADSMQKAIQGRPEINVARDRVASAQFGRTAARGEFLPRLAMRGSAGFVHGENIVDGFQEGAAIHLDVPLYHGGQQLGELRAAQADIRQAAADAQSLLNDISLQVTLAHREVTFGYERIGLAKPAVTQAEEALRIVRERFRNGTATPTDVVVAQNSLTRAQQRYVSARIEYLAALARLAYSIGEEPMQFCAPLAGPNDSPPAELPIPLEVPVMIAPHEQNGDGVQWQRAFELQVNVSRDAQSSERSAPRAPLRRLRVAANGEWLEENHEHFRRDDSKGV